MVAAATYERTAASFDIPNFVDVVMHSYRFDFGLAPPSALLMPGNRMEPEVVVLWENGVLVVGPRVEGLLHEELWVAGADGRSKPSHRDEELCVTVAVVGGAARVRGGGLDQGWRELG